MDITFQKKSGEQSLGILFFWRLTIKAKRPLSLRDLFIPELFFDYLYIKTGGVQIHDGSTSSALPRQTLKTLYLRPLSFTFSTPLVLYGARLTLPFAESFWEPAIPKNTFLTQSWLNQQPKELPAFQAQVTEYIESHRRPKNPYPMLTATHEETNWLAAYSPRHKRRLYKTAFGLSRKELDSIRSVQSFLEQTCDFAAENPRIIEHINPETFYDQPHLNHTFKKVTGLSPLAYFEANSILQDNLMAASYNAFPTE
jgi:AraC-like DNA-binding protein